MDQYIAIAGGSILSENRKLIKKLETTAEDTFT